MIAADCVGIDTNLDDKRGVGVGKQTEGKGENTAMKTLELLWNHQRTKQPMAFVQ